MSLQNHPVSRRRFMAPAAMRTAGLLVSPGFSPRRPAGETSPAVTILKEAAQSPVNVRKLRNNLSVLEGSGGNVIAFTGRAGKLMVDAGILM